MNYCSACAAGQPLDGHAHTFLRSWQNMKDTEIRECFVDNHIVVIDNGRLVNPTRAKELGIRMYFKEGPLPAPREPIKVPLDPMRFFKR